MNKKKIIKTAFLVLIFLLLWGLFWSYKITRTVRKNNTNKGMNNKHVVVKNIVVTETQDEKKYWELYAKSGEYNSQDSKVSLSEIIGNFYDKNSQVIISFKSDKGSYDEATKKVVLNGNNLFVGRDGTQLYASELIWQGQDKDILANGNVQYVQPNKIVTKAQKAVFNSTLTNFKVTGKTKTELFGNDNVKKKYFKP